jgi:hypothetical protein
MDCNPSISARPWVFIYGLVCGRIALLLAMLLAPLPALAVTHVQGGVNHDNSGTALSSLSVTLNSAIAPGDTIVCYMFVGTTDPNVLSSVADDQGNTYNIIDRAADVNDVNILASAELTNINNGPKTITMNLSPATPFASMACDEYSGVAKSAEIDAHTIAGDSMVSTASNAATTGNFTTGSADFVSAGIIDATGSGSFWTAGTLPLPFTLRQNLGGSNVGIATEDARQTSAGTVAGTFTQSISGENVIVAAIALKPAPGYFVATNGSDSNSGLTITSPWATLAHAQSMMEGNSCGGTPTGPCITYIRAGTYSLSATLTLTSADNGETWQ